jgi:hypothetical protein
MHPFLVDLGGGCRAGDVAFRLSQRRRHPETMDFAPQLPSLGFPHQCFAYTLTNATHDSGPPWIATPSMSGPFLPSFMSVSGALRTYVPTRFCWYGPCADAWRSEAARVTLSLAVRGPRSIIAGLAAAAALTVVAGCGSSSAPAVSPQAKAPAKRAAAAVRPTVVGGVSVRSVERALLARGGPPAPTTAACRASSSAERAAAPFGHTRRPLFTCELTLTGERARYVVQVLRNGCFVAERRQPGRAVYGCGADRS